MQRIRAESGFGCPVHTIHAVAGVGLKADSVLSAQDQSHSEDARAEVCEVKGCFRLHADILAIDGRRRSWASTDGQQEQ
jgi:hypothetical protein